MIAFQYVVVSQLVDSNQSDILVQSFRFIFFIILFKLLRVRAIIVKCQWLLYGNINLGNGEIGGHMKSTY